MTDKEINSSFLTVDSGLLRDDQSACEVKRCNEINLSCIREQEHRVISSELLHHQDSQGIQL